MLISSADGSSHVFLLVTCQFVIPERGAGVDGAQGEALTFVLRLSFAPSCRCPVTDTSLYNPRLHLQKEEQVSIDLKEPVALTFALRYLNSFAKATQLASFEPCRCLFLAFLNPAERGASVDRPD